MKILTKAFPNKEQIDSRIELVKQGLADGVELYVPFTILENKDIKNAIIYAFNNLDIVHIEPFDYRKNNGKDPGTLYDLVDILNKDKQVREESRRFVEETYNLFLKYKKSNDLFNIHLIGNCNTDMKKQEFLTKLDVNGNCFETHQYFNSLDPTYNNIILENVYPEVINNCIFDYVAFGKFRGDFAIHPKRGRTLDVAHLAITHKLYRKSEPYPCNQILMIKDGRSFLSYYYEKEEKAIEIYRKFPLEEAIIDDLDNKFPIQIHLCNFKGYQDGVVDGELDLKKIISHIHPEFTKFIVTEVKDEDYIDIPNQKRLIINLVKEYAKK